MFVHSLEIDLDVQVARRVGEESLENVEVYLEAMHKQLKGKPS